MITYVVSTATSLVTTHLILSDINRRILDDPLKYTFPWTLNQTVIKFSTKTLKVVLCQLQFGGFIVNLEKPAKFSIEFKSAIFRSLFNF